MIKNKITAVLGPTNTGKTHLAIETMLSFESGMIGFPLRLLAREVYDKIVKITNLDKVALILDKNLVFYEEVGIITDKDMIINNKTKVTIDELKSYNTNWLTNYMSS